ncbi:MAG: UvrD-helicase domain-containing protein [Clostridiales bacterium]|nr:UvrD-helicase domain-containing protein [Clostridiales bacterium]
MELEGLNERQKEAVINTEGPVLVIAGAGSGKTKVLTTRIAYLIENKKVNSKNILAITFTNKAAKEMKDRVSNILKRDVRRMHISTFHSFGVEILREYGYLVNIDKNFTILDSDDSLKVIKIIIDDMNLNKTISPKHVKEVISSYKNKLVLPEEAEKNTYTFEEKQIVDIYEKYNKKLYNSNSVDFDDLLLIPYLILDKYNAVLEDFQEKYKYILIDEYQDTNDAQYFLVKILSAKYKNLFVVGDSDQSIYSFRGANYKNILNFTKDFPNAKVIKLEQNYRSTNNILSIANNVIKNNIERSHKDLWSSLGDGEKVKFNQLNTEEDEVNYVISEIKKISNQYDYDDIAIIYRTNAQSRLFEQLFINNVIPFKLVGSFGFFNKKEIKDLIAYLKLIDNPKDDISFLRIVNYPTRGIGNKTIENLQRKANLSNLSLYESIEEDDKKLTLFKNLIEEIKDNYENISLKSLVERICEKTNLLETIKKDNDLESSIREENIKEFITYVDNYEKENNSSLREFLENLILFSDRENNNENEEKKVNLMTVHAVKGLEFKVVFVVGLEESLFPYQLSLENVQDIEEERRLYYVAVTRAKEKLYLLSAKRRYAFAKISYNPVSRFVYESNIDIIKEKSSWNVNFKVQKEQFYEEKNNEDYNVGDLVYHENFGKGSIVEIHDDILVIAFSYKYGIKKLLKNHKKLTKYEVE